MRIAVATTLGSLILLPGLLHAVQASPDSAREAAVRALPLLTRGAVGHVEKQTCFACHNQALPLLALATARERGIPVDGEEVSRQARFIARFLDGARETRFLTGEGTGGGHVTAGYALLSLELAGWKPDRATSAVVEYLLNARHPLWRRSTDRPPSEGSLFTAVYLAARGLRVFGSPEQAERIASRRKEGLEWLRRTPALSTEDRTFRLLGLRELEADAAEIREATESLAQAQREDGGWSQLPELESDAYATGEVLVALHLAGGMLTSSPAYERGVAFLQRTQLADGSWYVKSRSKPFQPYYETGFPHGKDQFISSTASGWAATALLLAGPRPD